MTNNNQTLLNKKNLKIAAAIFGIILLVSIFTGDDEATNEVADVMASPRSVTLHTISADNGTAVKTADGSAFIVRSQSGGRVDKVAKVGDVVASGATVAQLENSAERAALIQAEGAYDAAVAAAGGNTTSQSTAKQNGVRTWNSATVSSAQIMYNSIDTYFSVSRNNSVTGFRGLESFGAAGSLNERRLAIEEILKSWESKTATVNEGNVVEVLNTLESELATIGAFIDDLAALVPRQKIDTSYTDEDRAEDTNRLAAARAGITESQRAVDAARTTIINSSGSGAAASSAQVKQALGVLASARANYNKTIIKTPVAGTITAVSITIGDIISVGNDVVFVASDTNQEMADTVTVPLTAVKFTPTKAFIFTVEEGKLVPHEVKTGLVTSDSIAISDAVGVTDIVADVRGLKAGEAVVTQ